MKYATDFNLLEVRAGVPLPHEPLAWDRRLGVSANLNRLEAEMHRYQRWLPDGELLDEAALLAPNSSVRECLIHELGFGGWQVFNRAADLVFTNPFSTRYVVEYTFLNHPRKPYRLEVMMLGQGFSPLHQALWSPNGVTPEWGNHPILPIPHLSYKRTGPEARKLVRKDLDRYREELGFILAQACQSTYGEFWYLTHVDSVCKMYLKPRINTRDE